MGVNISGVQETKAQLRAILNHLESSEPMQNICEDVKERVLKRTKAGRDYRNRKFAPYSTKYARRKGSTKVNLRVTGEMLDSMKARAISARRGVVELTTKELIANIHTQGIGKQPQRNFMDITPTALQEFVTKHHDDEIKKILGRG